MISFTSGALSITPLKEPIPRQATPMQMAISDTNKTLIKETLARFPIMEEREIREFRFFEVDFLP